uniref:Uncharacterized protein n=1 Tax=Ananas comosus var. bracteatus TaxID=296719 RepID=A0A6V7NQT2_ANACO|nr:unnamed protein product [Ananas comosus var. bracteatus]
MAIRVLDRIPFPLPRAQSPPPPSPHLLRRLVALHGPRRAPLLLLLPPPHPTLPLPPPPPSPLLPLPLPPELLPARGPRRPAPLLRPPRPLLLPLLPLPNPNPGRVLRRLRPPLRRLPPPLRRALLARPPAPPSSGDDDGDGSIPLAAVQVTVFPSRGICVGLSVHHVACDDSSSMHFVRSWAAACQLGGAEPPATAPPFYDRSVIADPNGLCSKTLAEMRQLAANGPPPPPPEKPPLLIASFSLGRDWIEQLKQRVTAKAAENGLAIHSSTFVAACAFAWICLIKSQRGSANKKSAHLLFSVECRSRLNPPIPEEYFGNCLRPCFVEAKMADLVEKDGVLAAAMAIGRAIKGLENGVLEGAEGWMQKILSILPEGPMSVAGSPRFQVYGTDFGWGRPKKVDLPSIEKTPGTVSLAESSDEQGGVEIGLVLPKDEMDAFQSCFYDELKLF